MHEIASLRSSINVLEEYLSPKRYIHVTESADVQPPVSRHQETQHDTVSKEENGLALLASQGGGLYAGPTSTATYLVMVSARFLILLCSLIYDREA